MAPGFSVTLHLPFAFDSLWTELFLVEGTTLAPPIGTLVPKVCTYSLQECRASRLVQWSIIEQQSFDDLVMHGSDEQPPQISFELSALEHGRATSVRIAVACTRVTRRAEEWWWVRIDRSAELQDRLERLGSAWAEEMQKRGYSPLGSRPQVPSLVFDDRGMARPPTLEIETTRSSEDGCSTATARGSASTCTSATSDGSSWRLGIATPHFSAADLSAAGLPKLVWGLQARGLHATNATAEATAKPIDRQWADEPTTARGGQKLTARSRPFWQLEQEKQERQRSRREAQEGGGVVVEAETAKHERRAPARAADAVQGRKDRARGTARRSSLLQRALQGAGMRMGVHAVKAPRSGGPSVPGRCMPALRDCAAGAHTEGKAQGRHARAHVRSVAAAKRPRTALPPADPQAGPKAPMGRGPVSYLILSYLMASSETPSATHRSTGRSASSSMSCGMSDSEIELYRDDAADGLAA